RRGGDRRGVGSGLAGWRSAAGSHALCNASRRHAAPCRAGGPPRGRVMIVGVLLAAGGSRRFGSQKLVTPVRGAPLIRHGADLLKQTTDHVVPVIGSDALMVRAALKGTGAEIIENPEWRDGLSTSLRRGVASVSPLAEAVVVAL